MVNESAKSGLLDEIPTTSAQTICENTRLGIHARVDLLDITIKNEKECRGDDEMR